MSLETNVLEIVDKIRKLHQEDPKIYEYWDELTDLLCHNEEETNQFLLGLNDPCLVEDLSSVFDDVALRLQSKEFIKTIKSIDNMFSGIKLGLMIKAAENNMIE